MRYIGTLTLAIFLASCGSDREPTEAPSGGPEPSAVPSETPAPVATASDPDPTKRAALWLDENTEPRQQGRYAPRDECATLPGARAFREKLAAAVLARDAEAIAGMAVPDVRLGFGGQDGRARLLQKLKAADGALMSELEQLLPLGCAGTDGGGLTIPWYFAQNFGDTDSYSAMLTTGTDIPLLATANSGAAVRQRLSWDIVSLEGGLKPGAAFQQVRTAKGQKGYIATAQLRSLLDHRLLAVRQGEEWKITALLAGD